MPIGYWLMVFPLVAMHCAYAMSYACCNWSVDEPGVSGGAIRVAAYWRQAPSSRWNCVRSFPCGGKATTLGPDGGTVAHPAANREIDAMASHLPDTFIGHLATAVALLIWRRATLGVIPSARVAARA